MDDHDPNVSIAFLLGWRARRAVAFMDSSAVDDDETPGIGDPLQQYDLLSRQIDAGLAALTAAADAPPSFAGELRSDAARLEGIHGAILERLYAKDASLGKAACLGSMLHAFCSPLTNVARDLEGASPPPPSTPLAIEQVPQIKLLLAALASKLPASAAHCVINSLSLWEEERRTDHGDVSRERLRKQGIIWRSFLSGETAPRDVLHLTDYVGTADQLVRAVRGLFHKALWKGGSLASLLLVVIALVVIAVALLVFAGGSAQSIVGAAGSLIAAFGLTWKGIGQFFGNAVAKAEQALWDSEIDWSIAYRATIAKSAAAVAQPRKDRRQDHYDRWQEWDRQWPSTPLDDTEPAGI